MLTVLLSLLAFGWLFSEFASKPVVTAIAMILTHAAGSGGETLAHRLSSVFAHIATTDTFALVMGVYSAVLGFFVPSGGGKWIIEAPYVMQAANAVRGSSAPPE